MKLKLTITGLILFTGLVTVSIKAQEYRQKKQYVETINGFAALQLGIPSESMQKAIKNNMGNLGFGGGFAVLTNPFSWGKNKRNSPLRIGGEAGYTYYGRFLSEVNINGYKGDFKTSYGILQLNGVVQLRPPVAEAITPFIDILAGGDFYLSRTKENLDFIESSLGVQFADLDNYSSASFNKGIAVGCYIGNHKDPDAARFMIRVSYNRGNSIKYIIRNSLEYNAGNGSLVYYVDKAPVNYFMVQIGVGR